MALNAGSHNIPGEKTGPVTGAPPPVSDESKNAILNASNSESTGQTAPGQDGGDKDGEKKQKSEKELAKERAKAEKQAKFEAKKAKEKVAAAGGEGKAKEKKEKKEKAKDEVNVADYVEETPKGQKKILKPLDDAFHKAYIPKVVESAWYDWWEAEGYFKPEFTKDGKKKEKGSFVIVIPPPNVTGKLHIGHALATSLQDVLIRWHRMKGFTTLYLPGCDHAGISTQSVVENMLYRRQKKTRHDLGRSKFIEVAQEWKEEYHSSINKTLRRMGGSLDWTREGYTLSPELSAAVTETFVRLHEDGYIYRSNRLVNWCTKLSTALSNLEVDNKEIEGRTLLDVPGYEKKVEFGVITHFKYPIDGTDEFIEVATTRPETMLGDTAIAVHPNDERYKSFLGKKAKHPFIEGRSIPIIADDYVDPEFGTGAVKITPAHDPNDFAIGQRHNLEFINILNEDGTLNDNAGPFAGKRRFDVRYEVTAALEKAGLFVKKENNPMKIPLCSKTKDVIEPVLRAQWWMKMREFGDAAMDVVRDNQIKIQPQSAEKNYFAWLKNINDWCLSRQLWWGHQIPAYYVKVEGENQSDADDEYWVVGRTDEEAKAKAEKKFAGKKYTLERDPDVLDTWFSSGLWPFSTLGWPKETQDLRELFPTNVLETGWDILFFWVARMIMMSLKLTGKIPFKEVYCHSLVRDSEGRKMSKSLGNVIDPVDIMDGIELKDLHEKLYQGNLDPKEVKNAERYQKTAFPQGIPECGADALRFSLVQYTTGGGDIAFDVKVMQGYRRFCNKIYQATKFVLGNLDKDFVPQKTGALTGKESLAERWILHKFNDATKAINNALEEREFSHSTQVAYHYWYDELCDVYIENSKTIIQEGTPEERLSAINTLYTALEGALLLIHPYMPFLTEELWQRLPRRPNDTTPSIVLAAYPQYDASLSDPASEAACELVLGCSKGIRSLLSEYSIKDDGRAFVLALDATSFSTASAQHAAIKALSGKSVTELTVLSPTDAKPAGCAVFPVSAHAAVYVHVKGRVDIDKEIEKASAKRDKASQMVVKQRKIVESVRDVASKAVVELEEAKLRDGEAEVGALQEAIEQFRILKMEG